MKQILFWGLLSVWIVSCNNSADGGKSSDTVGTTTTATPSGGAGIDTMNGGRTLNAETTTNTGGNNMNGAATGTNRSSDTTMKSKMNTTNRSDSGR